MTKFVMFVALIGLIAIFGWALKQRIDYDDWCRTQGGEPLHLQTSNPVCLKNADVIPKKD